MEEEIRGMSLLRTLVGVYSLSGFRRASPLVIRWALLSSVGLDLISRVTLVPLGGTHSADFPACLGQ
jgi:hypothetical protein